MDLRRFLDRLTAWSPALMLGALAALTYWLDAQVGGAPDKDARPTRHEPDMFIENFRAVSLGPDGTPRQSLTARRAEHFPDDRTSEFVEPRLALSDPGRPSLELTAKHGKLSADQNDAWFTGNVRAVRDAPAGDTTEPSPGGKMTLTTEALHVAIREERIDTDQPVTIEDARGIIRGVGLDFDNVAKTARLRGRISGTIEPQSAPIRTP
ncbi:MAG TPA: LPS export ABC transporter periplasmic protein LptC [Casimicrobiaceae bacterium]|nr:LPS export ABC transporter periplasmic protein LptC [Casimicrobiaceae bacterium]